VVLVALALPFVLNPVETTLPPQARTNDDVGYPLYLKKVYGADNPNTPATDVRRGKHVLALFSLTCPHCKAAALKMNVMHKRHPELPFQYLLHGNVETRLKPFLLATQYADVPYSLYNDEDFYALARGAVPAIYWLQNDTVVKTETIYTLNEDSILNWVNSK